jgi:hypothetical protein
MALRPLDRDILVVVHRLAGDYGETDSDAVADELVRMGHQLPPALVYRRLFGDLRDAGYLKPTTTISAERVVLVELDSLGREEVEAEADPMEQVYSHARRLFGSDAFAAAYPDAFQPWSEAERLLFGDDPQAQLATIGFKLRDSTQAFATALVNEHKPPDADLEIAAVKNRLRSVISMHKSQLGKRRPAVLEALVKLWDADVALIQRQTHANEQDVLLNVNDARRVVSLTMFLIVEFAAIIDELPDPVAPLEGPGEQVSPE